MEREIPRYNVGVDIHDGELNETIADSGFNTSDLLTVARHLEDLAKKVRDRERRRREDAEVTEKYESKA